ncbi:MAG: hypothetical protein ABI565_01040 [Vicinamibacteria bacterium]
MRNAFIQIATLCEGATFKNGADRGPTSIEGLTTSFTMPVDGSKPLFPIRLLLVVNCAPGKRELKLKFRSPAGPGTEVGVHQLEISAGHGGFIHKEHVSLQPDAAGNFKIEIWLDGEFIGHIPVSFETPQSAKPKAAN